MLKRFVTLTTIVFAGLVTWPLLITRAQIAPATQSAAATNQEASGAPVDPEEMDQHLDGWGRPVPKEDWVPLNWPKETVKSGPPPTMTSLGFGNPPEAGGMESRRGARITIS